MGSPMPMRTMLETGSPESFRTKITWSSISPAVRSRTFPARVEAQKAQPMRQPTWEEIQTVFPWWYCIKTDSMQFPSASSQRYFTVPSSREVCFRAIFGGVRVQHSFSFSRSGLERFVISSQLSAPFWSQLKSCLPRKAGSPNSRRSSVSSGRVMDRMSFILFSSCGRCRSRRSPGAGARG